MFAPDNSGITNTLNTINNFYNDKYKFFSERLNGINGKFNEFNINLRYSHQFIEEFNNKTIHDINLNQIFDISKLFSNFNDNIKEFNYNLNYYHFHFKRFNDISLNYLYHKKTDHDKNINDDPKNEESSGISFFNNTKKNKIINNVYYLNCEEMKEDITNIEKIVLNSSPFNELFNLSNHSNIKEIYIDLFSKYDKNIGTINSIHSSPFSVIPNSITHLTILNYANGYIVKKNIQILTFPTNLKYLKINDYEYDFPKFPEGFKTLIFDEKAKFNSILNLPESTERLELPNNYKVSIRNLPNSIKYLRIGFNKYDEIPNSVTHLKLNNWSSCFQSNPIIPKNILNNLLFLNLGENYNHPLDDLPDSLEELITNRNYGFNNKEKKMVISNKLPNNLKRIYINDDFNSISIPEYIIKVYIHDNFHTLSDNSFY